MRRFWTSFVYALTTEFPRPKPMDEASRKKRLKQTFERVPVACLVCFAVTSILVYFGILRTAGLAVAFLSGMFFVRMRLYPLQQPPFIPIGWLFVIYIWTANWFVQNFVKLPHITDMWWGILCEAVLKVFCAAPGILATASLITWVFREPFWQYITGEKWPEKLVRPMLADTPANSAPAGSVPASALPYNY